MPSSCDLNAAQIEGIAKRLKGPNGVSIKDRKYHFRTYAKCFIGSEAVDWFVDQKLVKDRTEAVEVGQSILDIGMIHHVVDDHNFKDEYLYYRFKEDDPADSNTGPSAKTVTGECGSFSMYLERKGTFTNKRSFYALAPSQPFLFKYGSELDSHPKQAFPLNEMTIASVTGENASIEITFDNESQFQEITLLMPNEDEQLNWMKRFEKMGVKMGKSKEIISREIEHSPNIYPFQANTIDGEEITMEKYKGHVTLIVNVASFCGLTEKNYTQLQQLHELYNESGLRILGFPCNQFGNQEPKSNAEIKEFATEKYNAQFQLFSKIKVNGSDAHPLYKYLKSHLSGTLGNFIKWNFAKFLCNKEGVPTKRYSPTTQPLDIEEDIKELLK